MSGIIGFLTAHWPYILAYPFVGHILAKLKWKLFDDERPTSKLKNSEKVIRCLFFPVSGYNDKKWQTRRTTDDFRGLLEDKDEKFYNKLLVFFWPLALLPSLLGFIGFAFLATFHLVLFLGALPEKSCKLLQSGCRRLKLLAPGKNQDIKANIGQIDEFNKTLKVKMEKIKTELEAISSRLRIINANLDNWQVVVRKNQNLADSINPIIKSLIEEIEKLTAMKSNLQKLSEELNTAESNLSGFMEVLWRCSSTIQLSIPVTVEGPGLIKQDYLATLAADTVSQAEAEMNGIKEELEKYNSG